MHIIAPFLLGPDDLCWLPHKLKVLRQFANQILILTDPAGKAGYEREVQEVVNLFADPAWCKVRTWRRTCTNYPMAKDGPTWDEGRMRQAAWDWAASYYPHYILLGDADEVPSPAFGTFPWREHPEVVCWYADWMNLIHDTRHAIGGGGVWSYENANTNKKGMLVKWNRRRHEAGGYRYRPGTRHVRMEPSPLSETSTVYDGAHVLGPVPLLHHRWANWPRWEASPSAALPAYQPWPPAGTVVRQVGKEHQWNWLPDLLRINSPVAVVGNGACSGWGEVIDSHKTVIRFNNFVTEGHEADVGSRCDLWVTNCWDDVQMRPWTKPMMTVVTEQEQPERVAKWLGTYPHMEVPTSSWTDNARHFKQNNPSTGLTFLAALEGMLLDVNVFGFDGLQNGHYFDPAHTHTHPKELHALQVFARVNSNFKFHNRSRP